MKDLIEKLEALKYEISGDTRTWKLHHNDAIRECIKLVQESITEHDKGAIHAKALRKKGTDKWYYLSDKGKILSNDKWPSHFGNPKDLLRVFNIANVKLPPDAVLVDIIIVTPKNECDEKQTR
jgi:hypothetical protein